MKTGSRRQWDGEKWTRPKRPDNRAIAKTKLYYVTHGGDSNVLRNPLDGRSPAGKAYKRFCQAMQAHLGGDLSFPEEKLIDQAARFSLLVDIAWRELLDGGVFKKNGELSTAFEAFFKATRNQREVLNLLGLKRREKEIEDLASYLAEQDEHHESD